jgi:hypothetical protein
MSLFKKADNDVAYLKMGLYGDAGSGKTWTAALVAKGLVLYIEKLGFPKPGVFMIDTERGSSWVRDIFDKDKIDFEVAHTRAFTDLKDALTEVEKRGGILITDSISHFWQEVQQAFLQAKSQKLKRRFDRLEFQDFAVIKPQWEKFTSMFLNAQCHVILCGRSASIYEHQERDDNSGKKDLITVGTRMGAEKNMSYEPSLNVEMFIEHLTEKGGDVRIINKCVVMKDRSDTLNGQEFSQPNFETFLPHIKKLNIGGKDRGIDMTRDARRSSQEVGKCSMEHWHR